MSQYTIPNIQVYFKKDLYDAHDPNWIDYGYEQYVVFDTLPSGTITASLKFYENYDGFQESSEIKVTGKTKDDALHHLSRVLADYFTEESR